MLSFIRKSIKKIFVFRSDEYVEWQEYKKRINFLDTFAWQQSVRKQSIRNL